MDILIQVIVTGFATGGVYGLIALGFVLIYKATSVLNLAMGEFMTLGAFVCFTVLTQIKAPFSLALFLTLVAAIILGILVERLILRPLIGEPIISVIMVTIGLGLILKGLMYMIWTPAFQTFPEIFPPKPLLLGFAVVPSGLLWGFVFAIIGTVAFLTIFKFSRTGVAMRAVANDQQAALSMGISVRWVFALAWCFGAMASVIGGIVIGNISGISVYMGDIGLKVLAVIILGGLDSIGGAILGGFIIGILENLTGLYIDPLIGGGAKDVAPFFILVFILMIRPYGLFGKEIIERV
ncbi:MAG: branched-chain amino acid ABC transporter permease [Proteobacteria bacterium]|nr:branched-chain amino acid ABC transporter permease [Desulfobacterales bacterium]MBL7173595.1 branched-chain amino acid ABC transporter permease [Desulfobacteraceae bacterium]MBU0988976.1 branched-chain amino acid ABC transporter permease [Pseudomonadota bacterium]MBU1904024.1 branched-chain amino acid ABC transporter permease [Pseudomonadota bacterium]